MWRTPVLEIEPDLGIGLVNRRYLLAAARSTILDRVHTAKFSWQTIPFPHHVTLHLQASEPLESHSVALLPHSAFLSLCFSDLYPRPTSRDCFRLLLDSHFMFPVLKCYSCVFVNKTYQFASVCIWVHFHALAPAAITGILVSTISICQLKSGQTRCNTYRHIKLMVRILFWLNTRTNTSKTLEANPPK